MTATATRPAAIHIQQRDIDGLVLCGEHGGAPYDLLAAALDVQLVRLRGITARWRKAGYAATGQVGPGPAWCWLTAGGMADTGLDYRPGPPHLARVMHVRAILAVKGTAETPGDPAIRINGGALFCRNIRTSGYQFSVKDGKKKGMTAADVDEFCTADVFSQFPHQTRKSLNLPIRDTPEVPWDDLKDWANVKDYKKGRKSDAEAIQAAIDSGKTTVYFPRGQYKLGRETVLVRGKVRRLIGCEASFKIADGVEGPGFKIVDGDAPVVVLERMQLGWAGACVTLATSRTVVLQHSQFWQFFNTGTGDVFIEDVCLFCTPPGFNFNKGQCCWARQLNVENEGRHILNDGGFLWVLGLKTERGGTVLETRNGGVTEILGGFMYTTSGPKGKNADPMFVCNKASMAIIAGEANFGSPRYDCYFSETRGSETKKTRSGLGTLYAGYDEAKLPTALLRRAAGTTQKEEK